MNFVFFIWMLAVSRNLDNVGSSEFGRKYCI